MDMRTIPIALALIFWIQPAQAGPATEEINADNWATQVSFAPSLPCAACKKSKKVSKANAAEFADLLPEGLQVLIEQHGLELTIGKYQAVFPSEAYMAATDENRGKAKLVDIGDSVDKRGIANYEAGLPFVQPKTGLEVAWNHHYAYGGDDAEITYGVHWVSASAGLEHTESWRLSMIRATNRTDLEPIPSIETFAEKGIQGAGLTYALTPYDKKGFGAVYFKSVEPRNGQGHTYVPAMRRVLKNAFGTRGDTWNATDLFFEDVRGYSGYPEWMRWKIKAKTTVLLPMHSGVETGSKNADKTYRFDESPHWNPRYSWEPRPVYVLEAIPKLPDYPYSRQTLYVDAEAFQILYKVAYDRKGQLWKILINSASPRPNAESGETLLGWSGTVVIDLQSEHATVFHVHKARGNVGLDPSIFTVSNLRKRSR